MSERDGADDVRSGMSANPDSITSLSDAISIMNVPWERRLQTAAVASFVYALPIMFLCVVWSVALLLNPLTFLPMAVYAAWIYCDSAPQTGARKSEWMRGLQWWKRFAAYFPMSLRSEEKLNPDKTYVFGYHPHGIISVGALATFGTEGLNFSSTFQGIDVHLVTLPQNFRIPFLREIWLMLGICDSSKATFRKVLSKGSGKSIAVVVGGAAESLESAPGTMEITLCHRRGFVRQALLYGACVVPSVGFGETDVFETSRSEFMLRIQKKLQKALGFAIPLFHGRGVFQKAFGLLPFRRPVRVVIGRPIDPEVIDASLAKKARENGEEWLHQDVDGRQLVERVHAEYMKELQRVYDRYKNVCYPQRVKSMVIH